MYKTIQVWKHSLQSIRRTTKDFVRSRRRDCEAAQFVLAIQFFKDYLNSFGGASERATPVPFPNTEVKPLSADGTWVETPWESRSPPDFALQLCAAGTVASRWVERRQFEIKKLPGSLTRAVSFLASFSFAVDSSGSPLPDPVAVAMRRRHDAVA